MAGESENDDLDLADAGTNDAKGGENKSGEIAVTAKVGDVAGVGTIGAEADRVRKIRVPMILCPKVLNTDMSLRASAKAIAAIGTLTTDNFTGSADRPVGSVVRSEPLRISLVS